MGGAPIVECLEKYHPNVIITSRVADAALFLAPMVGSDFYMILARSFRGIHTCVSFFNTTFFAFRNNAVFKENINHFREVALFLLQGRESFIGF